jgi:hypothetical protein
MGKSVGGLLGTVGGGIVGGMFGMPSVGAAIGGSLFGGGGSSGGSAYSDAASAQTAAGLAAAQSAAFRPVGVTTRFGSSQFGMETDPRTGLPIVTSAGYTASPEIQALQNRLSALYGSSLGQAEQAQALGMPLGQAAQGLFGLGSQYLATSPEEARNQYMQEQYAMLDPIRQREEQRLGAGVFGRGRAGLNIGDTGQPELFALASARRGQDLQLAAQAEQAAQQRAQFGAGLFGTGANLMGSQYGLQSQALAPFLSQFGAQQSMEEAAQQALNIGAQLGGRNVNTTGANALLQSGMQAADTGLRGSLQTQASGQSMLNNFISGLGGTQGLGQIGQSVRGMFNPLLPAPISDISIYR